MANIRKLSAFRQLSLNCNSPTPEQRRKTLKKQFSEDLPDLRDSWLEAGTGIKISLNSKPTRNFDRPPPIKIAWDDNPSNLKTEDAVIIKKCKEVRRASTGKLSRQSSLEKESILHSKQELADRLRQHVKEKEQEKTNLKIILATDQNEELFNAGKAHVKPKLIQPLTTNNVTSSDKNLFQIRRSRPKINLNEIAYSPTRPSSAVVVVPIVEKDDPSPKQEYPEDPQSDRARETTEVPKPIDSVIIRPATAAFKREKFQKRTSSAFHATIKESSHPRPPLVRSSSAPTRPDHGKSKFVATKRKIKSAKRTHIKSHAIDDDLETNSGNKENPKSQKELNRTTAVNGSDVVTMVSLVSPAGSEGEEEVVEEVKEKSKSKASCIKGKKEEVKEAPKNLSLRKTVKTVSFQQSSIHAIRSFSASFPARRSSMATAIMLGNNAKTAPFGSKVQEKRSTNSNTPDDDERVPKRRLVRSQTEEAKIISCEPEEAVQPELTDDEENSPSNANFTVNVKSKEVAEVIELPEEPAAVNVIQPEKPEENPAVEEKETKEVKYGSPKEKQCWDLYRKMTEKGINVSFDTILRGMLTPTEYRLSRKNTVVVEEDTDACGDVTMLQKT